jgi:GNAT superfamily N-acetyltransferase
MVSNPMMLFVCYTHHIVLVSSYFEWKIIPELLFLVAWGFLINFVQNTFIHLQKNMKLFKTITHQTNDTSSAVTIVDFDPVYTQAFKDLNKEWISAYFKMEASDYKALDDAQTNILDNGGHIIVALYNDEPVGVCALIKMQDPKYQYELAKMAVSPSMRGKKIGWILGQAVIDKARLLGASYIYLESNTILTPAIRLYEKLGFTRVEGRPTPYERCNIQMEMSIS